ncbi:MULTISPECIES: type VI lipase adapter Tla3 domain-containing protein [Pseudomonas]|uniref:DUF2875 domain-containing protein n=2 Tax=Pseudomonas putida group TaxID=136845 RepID=A0A1B2F9F9_PSEPU|nr:MULTISPECIES: DUF2875 family protein [Pseudomonas]ANY88860.1 hypothetical protein IEC33019_3333 [Pseudomonas putida]
MKGDKVNDSARPSLGPYFWLAGVLFMLWFGFLMTAYPKVQEFNMVQRDIKPLLALGVSTAIGIVALVFSIHWWLNALASEKAKQAAYRRELLAALAEQESAPAHTFSLEIRGAGVAIHRDAQTRIWKFIKDKNNNFASIYSRDPKSYEASLTSRRSSRNIKSRLAFKHSAGESVAYWPIPVFSIGPPKQPSDTGAAANILGGRNAATLGVTLFLWQEAEDTTHAQHMIERLFTFFDANVKVPQALIVSEDGDIKRNSLRVAGTLGLQNGHVVPTVYENAAGLLLARSDRVDRYIRFSAVDEAENNQNKNTDLGKLWAFYWKYSPQFRKVYEEAKRAEGIERPYGPGTMSTAYWQSKLPELWQTISNRGPGHFEPSPWLPIRWAQHQVKEFDASPVLGYLHRPIKVLMQDENGKRLKPALQARALQAGWLQALETLPKGHEPVRVFYDTTHNLEAEIALTNALHALNTDGHGLDIGNVEEGYDIGRRLGNTGVSGALVQINLATIASYLEGGTSAVVYAGADGSLTVQMVRPPDEARKAKNRKTRGQDPFSYGSPG